MARISVGGGVSDARAVPGQPGYVEPVPVEELEAADEVEEDQAPVPAVEDAPKPQAPAAAPVQDTPAAQPVTSAAPAAKGGAA